MRIFGLIITVIFFITDPHAVWPDESKPAPTAPASPHAPCPGTLMTLDALTMTLHEQFKEDPLIRGIGRNGRLLLIFASKGGETWTLVAVDQQKTACIIGFGDDLQVAAPGEGT